MKGHPRFAVLAILFCLLFLSGCWPFPNSQQTPTPTPTPTLPPAQLDATPTTLNFDENHMNPQAVKVSNRGRQALSWVAHTDGSPWLIISPAQGTINPGEPAQLLFVRIEAFRLSPGEYRTNIFIASNGGTVTIQVFLLLRAPS